MEFPRTVTADRALPDEELINLSDQSNTVIVTRSRKSMSQ